jgi:tetratricopeptide (TPR) repeat protein
MILGLAFRVAAVSAVVAALASAQPALSQANSLDVQGKGAEARALFQQAIDGAPTPEAKSQAERAMAMSWGFESNCAKAAEYEQKVIDYWVTQEKAQPGNAFYQQGEMANEAARVCIDSGDLDSAAKWYQKGRELGLREPGISSDRKALWDYRLEHALARIAARRGNRADAVKHVEAAKIALEKMTELRAAQEAFLPYLTGYVALYLGDHDAALADLLKAQKDPFTQCLLGQTYEKLGQHDKALEQYRLAAAANGHNPPAARGIPFAKKKLAAAR